MSVFEICIFVLILVLVIGIFTILIYIIFFKKNTNKVDLNGQLISFKDEITKSLLNIKDTGTSNIMMINEAIDKKMSQLNNDLGKIESMSNSLSDIQKAFQNSKLRGNFGEKTLVSLIDDFLSPNQYVKNFSPTEDSDAKVEVAIKIPDKEHITYLPIDSKFPANSFINLENSYKTNNEFEIKKSVAEFTKAIKEQAKNITKYIVTPKTTDFAIMFIPSEGIFNETIKLGLVDICSSEYNVLIASPYTLWAIINAYQIGFKLMNTQGQLKQIVNAIQEFKNEFEKYNEILDGVKINLAKADSGLQALMTTRTKKLVNSIDKFEDVKQLPNS